jgi:MFS family permease
MFNDLKKLWRIAAFRTLFLARVISNIGNGLGPIALAFGVLALPDATATTLSIVMACQLGPMVLFMLFGGVVADRYPRAMVVGSSDIVLSAFVVTNGIMLITGTATVLSLAIIAVISGSLNALWWPAFAGLVPEIVEERDIQSANSVIYLGSNMANMFGTVAGGIIVATIGAGWAMVTDGISFLIAGSLVFTLRKYGKTREKTEHSPGVLDDLIHGWREFISRSWVVAVVAGYSIIAMIIEGTFAVVGPVHANEILGGPKPWSWIMAAMSVGMAVGVIISMRLRPTYPLLVGLLSQLGMVAWILTMGLTNWIPAIVVTAFFGGISMDLFMVFWQTAMQTNIPRESLSRVTSYDAFGSLAFAPIGLVIAGPITERIGSSAMLVTMSVIFTAVLAAVLLVPSVRNLRGQKLEAQPT